MRALLKSSVFFILAGKLSAVPCTSSGFVAPSVVKDTDGASQLAAALNCSGGIFDVEWLGSVTVSETIAVVNGTVLTISGTAEEPALVDGANQIGLFFVHGATLQLSNITLANGTGYAGGAIDAYFSDITVVGCAFVGNNATYGGAVAAQDSTVRVLGDTLFSANFATISGGGMYIDYNTSMTVEKYACWEGNSAEGGGGAVFAYLATVIINGGAFVGNNARVAGGAIFAEESSVHVYGNTPFAVSTAAYGGGIDAECDASNAAGSYILWDENAAGEGGGAIFAYEADVSLTNCTFVGNNATYGGAISLHGSSTIRLLGDAVFTDNIASDTGGAIYAENGTLVAIDGDAVWERNSALYGGGIRLYLNCLLRVSGSAFFERNSGAQGAGVWMSENSAMEVLGSSSVSFLSNSAYHACGGMLAYSSNAEFLAGSAVMFFNNTAEGGGAMCVWESGNASFQGKARFINNTALVGGGIQVLEGATLHLSGDVLMSGNTASSGGAISSEATVGLVITNTSFVSNVAVVSGGAITLLSSGTQLDNAIVRNSLFRQNTAGDTGGAVFIGGGFVKITGSNFVDNVVGRAGGALLTSGVTKIYGCLFSGNRGYTGPAISNTVLLDIHSTEFDGNALLCGDGFFLDWANVSAYESACDACPSQNECFGCIVSYPDTAQLCETALDRTYSPTADGTLQSLELEAGYWRSSNMSKEIRECYEAEACVGGTQEYCETGYTGPFCTVCVHGYSRGVGHTCSKCSRQRRLTGVIIMGVAVVGLITAVGFGQGYFKSTSSAAVPGMTERTLSSRGLEIIQSRLRATRAFQALKIIVVSWQIVTQFSTVASVTYPEVYDSFLKQIDVVNLNLGWMLSVTCLVETDFYDRLLLSTLMPLVIGCIVAATYNVATLKCPVDDEDARARLNRRYGAFFFWVSFLLYTTTSSAVFHTFACDNLDNGESYLRIDHRLSCKTDTHKFYMAYAGFMGIVYPFGIPFCYMFVLYRSRSRLKTVGREDDTQVATFRELWRPYRYDAYYYEVLECVRRIVLSGIVVFIFPNTAGQVATAFLLALVFCGVLMVLDPYSDPWDAWLARIGHVIVMMSMFVALLQKVDITEDDMFSQDVFAGALVLANCGMILAVAAEASGMCYTAIKENRSTVRPARPCLREEFAMDEPPAQDTSRDTD